MGVGDIWAAFTGSFSPKTVLAISTGHRKAWTEMRGLTSEMGSKNILEHRSKCAAECKNSPDEHTCGARTETEKMDIWA